MKELKPKPYIITIGIILLLFAISYIITFFAKITFIESLRIIFGSLYVLFLPGFVLSFLFFPKNDESSIDWIERLALSFALSIAIVPLTIFYLNLIGIRINLLNSFLTILLIILLGLVLLYIKGIKKSF
ncbi:DUF1616 domain-containing protein [Candidatus Pacearchaeota archaeon]|nr:DUF1616 domain-containing protein [Candidatus Pacearchaeota archaeon]